MNRRPVPPVPGDTPPQLPARPSHQRPAPKILNDDRGTPPMHHDRQTHQPLVPSSVPPPLPDRSGQNFRNAHLNNVGNAQHSPHTTRFQKFNPEEDYIEPKEQQGSADENYIQPDGFHDSDMAPNDEYECPMPVTDNISAPSAITPPWKSVNATSNAAEPNPMASSVSAIKEMFSRSNLSSSDTNSDKNVKRLPSPPPRVRKNGGALFPPNKPVPPLKPITKPSANFPLTKGSSQEEGSSADSLSSGSGSDATKFKPQVPTHKTSHGTAPPWAGQIKVDVFPGLHGPVRMAEVNNASDSAGTESAAWAVLPQTPTEHDVDEIYDEAVTEDLSKYDWYHGDIDRKETEERLKQTPQNGSFLVRNSQKQTIPNSGDTHQYTLAVMFNGKVKSLIIRLRSDGTFAIGKFKEDEVTFPTVPALIENHGTNNLKLMESGVVRLLKSPRKS